MKIGIDFDNTIVRYDSLFREVAIKEKLVSNSWDGKTKTEIRNYLCHSVGGEKNWMRLQGLVYGKYMHLAKIMPGVSNFLMSCNNRQIQVYIVSHKTEYGHFDPEKISLREEALKWMRKSRFFENSYFGLEEKDIYFANTRKEKVDIIDNLNCDWFIDDLPEVFDENHFPKSTKKILFGYYNAKLYQDKIVLTNWDDIYLKKYLVIR